jgi:hypothetical protein
MKIHIVGFLCKEYLDMGLEISTDTKFLVDIGDILIDIESFYQYTTF